MQMILNVWRAILTCRDMFIYACFFFFFNFVPSECSRPFIEMKILVGLRLCIFFSIIFFILLATLVSCSVCVQRIAETSKEGE